MDLSTRKIKFVQEFLELQSEDVISKFEKILKMERNAPHENLMSKEELNDRIDKSESDFKNNRFKKTSELLSKYK